MVDDYTYSPNPKRLYRSRDKVIAGVCGGIAERMGWDPTVTRVATAVLFFVGGSGVADLGDAVLGIEHEVGRLAPPVGLRHGVAVVVVGEDLSRRVLVVDLLQEALEVVGPFAVLPGLVGPSNEAVELVEAPRRLSPNRLRSRAAWIPHRRLLRLTGDG